MYVKGDNIVIRPQFRGKNLTAKLLKGLANYFYESEGALGFACMCTGVDAVQGMIAQGFKVRHTLAYKDFCHNGKYPYAGFNYQVPKYFNGIPAAYLVTYDIEN